ncbi:MAG: nucleoside 2-deoxyribosyltransferase [Thermoproteota archaeon]|nr:nucleoside 2-deoxyribosyltransferase [Thermoproteota archaeon]
MVCGSIGYGGIDDIRRIYTFLDTEGFDIVDHIVGKGMDYSDIKDFRNKKELSRQIVNHDLEYLKKADVLVVLANMPSYGAAIEMFVAKNSGKKIVLLAKDPVPTPWPINFSDYVVTTEEELIKLLWDLKKGVTY